MINIRVEFNNSFFKKTNSRILQESFQDVIEYTTETICNGCKDEAPVRTGKLRDGHYTNVRGLTGEVKNDVEYAPYVIFGTSRQSANNYPQRVINRINASGEIGSRLEQTLSSNGVIE